MAADRRLAEHAVSSDNPRRGVKQSPWLTMIHRERMFSKHSLDSALGGTFAPTTVLASWVLACEPFVGVQRS